LSIESTQYATARQTMC